MNKKLLCLVLTTAITTSTWSTALAGTVQSKTSNRGKIIEVKEKVDALPISEEINQAILEQGVKDIDSEEVVELLILSDGTDITDDLESMGAYVSKKSTSVYVVNIEASEAQGISEISAVKSVGMDKLLYLPSPVISEIEGNNGEEISYPNLEYDHKIVGTTEFWNKGYDGKGTKVAIIDTGVEPANEMLTVTTDGKIKIIDYKDFYYRSGVDGEGM